MSMSQAREITCPKCGKKASFQVWQSINTTLDPDMKPAVRDGSAFLFTCPHCQEKRPVEYGLLYHQMEDRMLIQVAVTEEDKKQVLDMFTGDRMAGMLKGMEPESRYLFRIVDSQNRLREKLVIFDCGYDDRLMEIYKVYLKAMYQEKHPEIQDIVMFFYGAPDAEKGIQAMIGGRTAGSLPFIEEMYQDISNLYLPVLGDIRAEQPIVDFDWAARFLRENREK